MVTVATSTAAAVSVICNISVIIQDWQDPDGPTSLSLMPLVYSAQTAELSHPKQKKIQNTHNGREQEITNTLIH